MKRRAPGFLEQGSEIIGSLRNLESSNSKQLQIIAIAESLGLEHLSVRA